MKRVIQRSTIEIFVVVGAFGGFSLMIALSEALSLPSTEFSVAARALTLAASLILLIYFKNIRLTKVQPFMLAFLFFWLAYIARLVTETLLGTDLSILSARDYWIWAVGACLIPAAALMSVRQESTVFASSKYVFFIYVVCAFVISSLGTTLVGEGYTSYDSGRFRLESLNPISVGHLGVSILILAVTNGYAIRHRLSKLNKVIWLSGIPIGLYLTVAAASRGPMVSLVVVGIFYLITLEAKKAAVGLALVAVLAFGILETASYFEEHKQTRLLSRIEAAIGGNDAGVRGRFDSYVNSLGLFLENPVFGYGLEDPAHEGYTHNIFLEVLMVTGIFGGIAFTIFMFMGVRMAVVVARHSNGNQWIALFFIQHLVASQFSGAIWSSTYLWYSLALCFSIDRACKKNLKAIRR